MIIGLGSDLCNIERIQNSLNRFGERFEARVFTDVERAKAARRPHTRAGTYAKRFAAKEAFSKAVGTGFKAGVFMRDIGVVNAPSGAPTLHLTGGALARLESIVPSGYRPLVHLTLTDDHPWAQAFVIIEAVPV
ncbi:MAG: holo-ACP synthase [Alphaproteobacteria bacterium]|nr:holo-ACP synthase [Alphaproteobacteria bacterium]